MNRIIELAKLIKPYKNLADVGCDHGFLIIKAFEIANIKKAIAIDNKQGPLNQAIKNIKDTPYYPLVRFSLSSGINDIDDDTEVLVLAGMGGRQIMDILNNNLRNVKRIITQANLDNYLLRKELVKKGFRIYQEVIYYENPKYYEMIVFEKNESLENLCELDYKYGPLNLKNRSSVFIDYLKFKLNILKKIKEQTTCKDEEIKEIERIIGENNED